MRLKLTMCLKESTLGSLKLFSPLIGIVCEASEYPQELLPLALNR